jgi:hypothetical protein
MADRAEKIAALSALAFLFDLAEMAARKNAPPHLPQSAGEIHRINEAWLAGREPPWQDSDPFYRSMYWNEAVTAAQNRVLACRPLPCRDSWVDSWLSIQTAPQFEFVEGCNRPHKIKNVERMDRAPLRKAIRQILATKLKLQAGDESMGQTAEAEIGLRDNAPPAHNPESPPAPADDSEQFPPNEWVDPSPPNNRYGFGGRKLLWELWKALVKAFPRRLTPDDFPDHVPTWKDTGVTGENLKQALSDLRQFWKGCDRQDLADRIDNKGGSVGLR